MGYDIFFGCDSLTEVTFGEGIKKIEEIFGFCKKLKTVNLPSTIDKIYGYCFYGCENLTTVSINENNKKYKDINGVVFSTSVGTMYDEPPFLFG